MRIGIFVVFAGRGFGGPQTYEERIVTEIADLDRSNEYHAYCLEPGARQTFQLLGANIHYHQLRPGNRWIGAGISLPLSLQRDGIDLMHATLIPPLFSPVPYVFTMHDVSPFLFPEFYPRAIRARLRALIAHGVRHAKAVICVSQSARESTIELFGIHPDRVAVVHHGINPEFRSVGAEQTRMVLERELGLNGDYLLHVGHIEPRKNMVRLLEAYDLFRRDSQVQVKLVLAGERHWDSRLFDDTLDRLALRESVIEIGSVRQDLMPALYSGARMLAFPSLWEGFGFPVLEAMACGTPVLTSNVSSLPEITGGAALLVDPYSVLEIAEGMRRLADDSHLRSELSLRGQARAADFTWQSTARQTLEVYRRAMAE